jgi:tellurite resistance protein TehA-like permease
MADFCSDVSLCSFMLIVLGLLLQMLFRLYFDPQPLRTQLWIPLLKHAMAAQK